MPPTLQLLDRKFGVGPVAFWSAVGVTAIVCILGIVFAVLTQRQTAPKTFQRRVSAVTGALSGLALLFWFVSMTALVTLLPRWR